MMHVEGDQSRDKLNAVPDQAALRTEDRSTRSLAAFELEVGLVWVLGPGLPYHHIDLGTPCPHDNGQQAVSKAIIGCASPLRHSSLWEPQGLMGALASALRTQ
jgi:hypothetical protein